MEQKYKKYCIYAICIIILILVGHLVYNYVINNNIGNNYGNNNGNNIESFIVDPSSLDLLKKQQSNKVSNKLSTSNPDGSTISKWSNKFYNLQTLSQVKPLSFWKPQIPISNGKEMLKLGDMVSQDPVYAPPTDKSLFVSGDAQPPTDYATILEFKGINFDGFYNELDMYVNNLNDLSNIFNSLKSTIQTVTSLNSLLQSGMPNIVSALNELIINKVKAGIGADIMSLNVLSSMSVATNEVTKVNNNSDIITLPAGATITLLRINADNQPVPGTSPIPLSFDININSNQKNDSMSILHTLSSGSFFGNLTKEQITFETLSFNVKSIPSLLGIVRNMIKTIKVEIAIFKKKNPELAGYLELDTIIPNIQNYIDTSLNYSYNYPVIKIPISELTNLGFSVNNTTLGYKINMFDSLAIPKLLNNMYFSNDITQLPDFETSQLAKFINNIALLTDLGNKISAGNLDMFSFKILAPIAPTNYVALGHIFVNITDNVDTIKANNKVGCVPKTCVKEVRNWRATDMIYEYSKDSVYFNIFYNPYVGTFIVNDRRGMPEGKVCKVIACVKQCTVVDDIINADKCARNFQNINKSLSADKPLTLSLSTDEEDSYYLEKIAKQSQHIALLQNKAHKMQIDTDKADIVNKEYNKSRLQNFVDVQQRNIDLVMKRLENDKNKIDVNVTIPIEVINNITSLIHDSPNIPADVKKSMIDKIINNKTMADSNVITGAEYRSNISKILKSCQDYDLNGFVRKDMAAQVCYGCEDPK